MATLQLDPHSGRWRIRFSYCGKEYKRSIKTNDRRQAESVRRRAEDTIIFLEQGRIDMPPGADAARFILSDGKLAAKATAPKVLTVGGLFATYRERLTEGAKEANTRRVEGIHARHLERLLGTRTPLASLTTADLQKYVDTRTQSEWRGKRIKPQTVKKEVDTLRAVWAWARRLGLVAVPPPGAGVVYPRQKDKPPFQTIEEVERTISRGGLSAAAVKELWDSVFLRTREVVELLDFVRGRAKTRWLYPMFVFAAHTGARKSEMLRAEVADFKFDEGAVLIREKKRRKGRESTRRVEMSGLLRAVMDDYFTSGHPGGHYALCRKPDEPLLATTAHEAFRWMLRHGKWSGLRGWHVLRHSFASNLAAAGVDQRVVDEFMGHQTEDMRRRYRHLSPEQRRHAIKLVFPEGE